MDERKIADGARLSGEDQFWMDKMRNITAESIKSVEEAAKQLVAMITVMEGIYAAILAFSGINKIPQGRFWAVLFYASPILLWLVSLFFALRVFKTRKYRYFSNSPDSSKTTFQQIAKYKYINLNMAYGFLVVSFAVAALGIMYWLYCDGIF